MRGTGNRERHGVVARARNGRCFDRCPAPEVLEFLASRRTETHPTHTSQLSFSLADGQLHLDLRNGPVQRFPVRYSLVRKVLQWVDFSERGAGMLDEEAGTRLLNDIVNGLDRDVILKVEDGDALTLHSTRFTDLQDLDVLKALREPIRARVTRDDILTRVVCDTRFKAEPVVGDACGLSYHIVNSETGFRALRVRGFILRYVCTNGAVYGSALEEDGRSHYGVPVSALAGFLRQKVETLRSQFPLIARRLHRATQVPPQPIARFERRLDRLLGFGETRPFMAEWHPSPQATLYDQFNYITDRAKRLDFESRLGVETFAGGLIAGAGADFLEATADGRDPASIAPF